MKQVLQSYSTGRIELADAPVPACSSNNVLVRNVASLISIGTERSIIELGKKSLLGKARARPDLVKRFIEKAQNEGLVKTFKEALGRLDNPTSAGWMRAETGRRRRAVVIEVRDNGPGVARTQKESIFQPYRSVEESRLGLGLSIVMQAVRVHGGTVDECGREGRGACFRVLLPATESERTL